MPLEDEIDPHAVRKAIRLLRWAAKPPDESFTVMTSDHAAYGTAALLLGRSQPAAEEQAGIEAATVDLA